jgi:hypothetical protein
LKVPKPRKRQDLAEWLGAAGKGQSSCHLCEEQASAVRCRQCGMDLCSQCDQDIHMAMSLREHSRKSLKSTASLSSNTGKKYARSKSSTKSKHAGLYQTHQKLICFMAKLIEVTMVHPESPNLPGRLVLDNAPEPADPDMKALYTERLRSVRRWLKSSLFKRGAEPISPSHCDPLAQFAQDLIENRGSAADLLLWARARFQVGRHRPQADLDRATRAAFSAILKHHGLLSEAMTCARRAVCGGEPFNVSPELEAAWRQAFIELHTVMGSVRSASLARLDADAASTAATAGVLRAADLLLRIRPAYEMEGTHGLHYHLQPRITDEEGGGSRTLPQIGAARRWRRVRAVVRGGAQFAFDSLESLVTEYPRMFADRACFAEIRKFLTEASQLDFELLEQETNKRNARALLRLEALRDFRQMLETMVAPMSKKELFNRLRACLYNWNVLNKLDGASQAVLAQITEELAKLLALGSQVLCDCELPLDTRLAALAVCCFRLRANPEEHHLLVETGVLTSLNNLIRVSHTSSDSSKTTSWGRAVWQAFECVATQIGLGCRMARVSVTANQPTLQLKMVFAALFSDLSHCVQQVSASGPVPNPALSKREAKHVSGCKKHLDEVTSLLLELAQATGARHLMTTKWLQLLRRLIDEKLAPYSVKIRVLRLLRTLFPRMDAQLAERQWNLPGHSTTHDFLQYFFDLVALQVHPN